MFFPSTVLTIFLGLVAALPNERVRRQYYATDEDPITGTLLATCTFYGDNTVDCSGRLRCRPTDVEDRIGLEALERICPMEPSQKTGTWDRDQVIPMSMVRSNGRIASCKFYANRQIGRFTCTGSEGDTWKGEYTGTINSAFRLGLPAMGTSAYGSSYPGAADDSRSPSYGSRRFGDDDYRYTTASPYGYGGYAGDRDRYTTASPYGYGGYAGDRDRYTTASPYGYGGYAGDRDRDGYTRRIYSYDRTTYPSTDNFGYDTYGRDRDRDDYGRGSNRYPSDYNNRDSTYRDSTNPRYDGGLSYDRQPASGFPSAEADITMCTYTSDGNGQCRKCTERTERRETEREIRTSRHYTCRGSQTPTTWTSGSPLLPNRTPSPYNRARHVATCIFRENEGKFECHSGSADGGCSIGGSSSDGYGSSSVGASAQKCLTGEKWTGTYSGSAMAQ